MKINFTLVALAVLMIAPLTGCGNNNQKSDPSNNSTNYKTEEENENQEQNINEQCNHNYVTNIIKESTYSEHGLVEYKCSLCGDSYQEDLPLLLYKEYNKDELITLLKRYFDSSAINYDFCYTAADTNNLIYKTENYTVNISENYLNVIREKEGNENYSEKIYCLPYQEYSVVKGPITYIKDFYRYGIGGYRSEIKEFHREKFEKFTLSNSIFCLNNVYSDIDYIKYIEQLEIYNFDSSKNIYSAKLDLLFKNITYEFDVNIDLNNEIFIFAYKNETLKFKLNHEIVPFDVPSDENNKISSVSWPWSGTTKIVEKNEKLKVELPEIQGNYGIIKEEISSLYNEIEIDGDLIWCAKGGTFPINLKIYNDSFVDYESTFYLRVKGTDTISVDSSAMKWEKTKTFKKNEIFKFQSPIAYPENGDFTVNIKDNKDYLEVNSADLTIKAIKGGSSYITISITNWDGTKLESFSLYYSVEIIAAESIKVNVEPESEIFLSTGTPFHVELECYPLDAEIILSISSNSYCKLDGNDIVANQNYLECERVATWLYVKDYLGKQLLSIKFYVTVDFKEIESVDFSGIPSVLTIDKGIDYDIRDFIIVSPAEAGFKTSITNLHKGSKPNPIDTNGVSRFKGINGGETDLIVKVIDIHGNVFDEKQFTVRVNYITLSVVNFSNDCIDTCLSRNERSIHFYDYADKYLADYTIQIESNDYGYIDYTPIWCYYGLDSTSHRQDPDNVVNGMYKLCWDIWLPMNETYVGTYHFTRKIISHTGAVFSKSFSVYLDYYANVREFDEYWENR